ncbi:hypothetical protein ScPMuIL_018758 [Solemya velum]
MCERRSSLVTRRQVPNTLTKLKMPELHVGYVCRAHTWDAMSAVDDVEEVEEEGKELFEHFVVEQIRREGLEAPVECLISASTPRGYQNPIWAKAGRELRMMADEFARTKERDRIKSRAEQVGIGEVSFEQFRDFLTELFFEGTITKERIMVLFFFCSDVAIRTLSHGVECFQQFFSWSVQFIKDHVCSWVRQHGGWGAVLCSSIHYLPRVALAVGVVFIIGMGISKLWRKP